MNWILALIFFVQIFSMVKLNVGSGLVEPLKVGAFKIRVFGVTKIKKKSVRDILVKVVNRYDILLIQDIRDASGNSIKILLAEVNKLAAKSNYQYKMVISHRTGRSASKEQYAFLYRNDSVIVKDYFTYVDTSKDLFEREPFIVRFWSPSTAVNDMVFVAIHTKPSAAVKEVDSLVDVYDHIVKKWKMNNIVIMGDFNAACRYVKDTEWKNIRLANDKRFWWLIDDCQDTSVKGSRCAYDRFVATGTELLNSIVINSAKAFNFKKVYNLDEKQAADVSDHFPIEFHIKGAGWKDVKEDMEYVLTNSLPTITKNNVYDLRRKGFANLGYKIYSLYKKSGGVSQVTLIKTVDDIKSAATCLEELHKAFPTLVTETQCKVTKYYLSKWQVVINQYPYQVFKHYTAGLNKMNIKIQLTCDVDVSPISCRVIIGKTI